VAPRAVRGHSLGADLELVATCQPEPERASSGPAAVSVTPKTGALVERKELSSALQNDSAV
jgi:hypothetical protein